MARPETVRDALNHPPPNPYPVPISTKKVVVRGEKILAICPSKSRSSAYRTTQAARSKKVRSFAFMGLGFVEG